MRGWRYNFGCSELLDGSAATLDEIYMEGTLCRRLILYHADYMSWLRDIGGDGLRDITSVAVTRRRRLVHNRAFIERLVCEGEVRDDESVSLMYVGSLVLTSFVAPFHKTIF